MSGRKWTDADRRQLIELRSQGLSSRKIGLIMDRTRFGICGALERMVQEGWTIPPPAQCPAVGGWRQQQVVVVPRPKRPSQPMWEMDDHDRRLMAWHRAKRAASKALKGETNAN